MATPLFIVSIWVHTVITDTDRYVHTVGPLADDPAVQEYVASQLSDAFKENVDVKAIVSERLPSSLQPLSGTITSAVNGFVAAAANRFTASPAFKTLWVDANRAAHRTISKVLTGDTKALDLSNGELTIDLGNVLRNFQQRLVDGGLDVASKVDLSNVHKEVVLADGERGGQDREGTRRRRPPAEAGLAARDPRPGRSHRLGGGRVRSADPRSSASAWDWRSSWWSSPSRSR